jgi:hypothetical protein
MLDGIKIKCIGFSVTGYGDPSYPVSMENYFKKSGNIAQVSYSSVGGLSIDALPYLLKTIVKKGDVDLVILEITTSWFSFVRTHQEEANNYIQLIINYLESIDVKIVFLNLYRKDIDDNDIVVQAIHTLAYGKYPILDFKAHYRKQFTDTGDDGTTDGVHPKPEAIEQFSTKVCEFIWNNFTKIKINQSTLQNSGYYDLLTLKASQDKEHFFDNHHGIALSTTKVGQGEILEIQFPEKKRISGIFYIFGPDTNQITLTLDGELINVPMRDEMSYYRRIGYRYLGIRDVQNLKVEHPLEVMKIKLAREPWEKVDKLHNYIIGFTSGI